MWSRTFTYIYLYGNIICISSYINNKYISFISIDHAVTSHHILVLCDSLKPDQYSLMTIVIQLLRVYFHFSYFFKCHDYFKVLKKYSTQIKTIQHGNCNIVIQHNSPLLYWQLLQVVLQVVWSISQLFECTLYLMLLMTHIPFMYLGFHLGLQTYLCWISNSRLIMLSPFANQKQAKKTSW